jgi:hypothetical protein
MIMMMMMIFVNLEEIFRAVMAQSVTGCGLDDPGIESWWGAIFHARPYLPWGPPILSSWHLDIIC